MKERQDQQEQRYEIIGLRTTVPRDIEPVSYREAVITCDELGEVFRNSSYFHSFDLFAVDEGQTPGIDELWPMESEPDSERMPDGWILNPYLHKEVH